MNESSTVILYTDAFNINSLKVVLVAEYCNENINVEKPKRCDVSDRRSNRIVQLPILEINGKYEFFSSNAASRYLFQRNKKIVDKVTDNWMEWECSIFQPCIVNCHSAKEFTLSEDAKSCLQYLELLLEKSNFLFSDENYGLADMIIWTNLYPLFQIYTVDSKFPYMKVKDWFFKLLAKEQFVNAVDRIFGATQADCLKKLISCYTCGSPSTSQKCYLPIPVAGFSLKTSVASKEENSPKEETKEYEFTSEDISAAHDSWLKGADSLPPLRPQEPVILPKKGEKNFLITSALPYVNNVPHLGNVIGAVLSADVFARYCRLCGYNTLYVCGTDEYGTATETKAIELGVTPREICDRFNKLHKEIYDWFNISFDYFGRTTTQQQTEIAQDIFLKLHKRDFLLEDVVEQLYCAQCNRFLADRFVEGTCPLCLYEDARGDQCDKCGKLINAPELKNPTCKVCKSTPHLKSSKHLFLDLPKLEPELKRYLDEATKTGWSNTAKVISYSWIKDGLKPRCITRDLKWGTPVPLDGFTDKVFYVWYDAPIGYLSITANYTKEWEQWWKQPDLVELYQFMAKDNVPFHSIIFPACQLGTKDNYTIVSNLVATEYLNYEDVKFSKSRGIGVFGDDAKNTGIPSDIWRFYLLYLRPENQDTYFSWSDLMLKNNSELLNNLGNFINRTLVFVSNNFGSVIPEMTMGDDEKYLLAQVNHELRTYITCMEKTKLRDAIRPMLNISRLGNQYIQSHKPWELIKSTDSDKTIAGTVLGLSANITCLLCTLMEPYMPETCKNLKEQLNSRPELHVLTQEFVCLLPPGHKLNKPIPLFQKIDQTLINELKVKYAGRQTPEKDIKQGTEAGDTVKIVNGVNESDIEKLTALVNEQGNKVRQLKTEKAAKVEIDKEVLQLLDLKRQLSLLKGENPDPPKGKSKGKTKK